MQKPDVEYYANRQGMNVFTTIVLIFLHIGAIASLFYFTWERFAAAVVHVLLRHRARDQHGLPPAAYPSSYKVPKWLEYFFAVCGTLTLEGGPIFWVATHRLHHQFSDQPGDPHSPRDGAFWSHMGWILFGETNHNNTKVMSRYAPDLAKDRFYVWLNNYHWVPIVVLTVIFYAIGGFPLVLWANFRASSSACTPPGP